MKLPQIFFDFDRYNIRADQEATLADNADKMKVKWSKKRFALEGYCDTRGTDEYNLALAERRCTSVYNFLVASGVDASRLEIKPIGETEQFNQDGMGMEQNYQENRRVHFVDISD